MTGNPRVDPPEWWNWELAFTAHVESRMEERSISELDLRRMLEDATELSPGRQTGRFLVSGRHEGRRWIVVLEPDSDERVAYVVTAFPTSQP
jgi:hypothetical protein